MRKRLCALLLVITGAMCTLAGGAAEAAHVVNKVIPSKVATGSRSVLLRLTGSGFLPDATVVACDGENNPDPFCTQSTFVTVESVRVLSSTLANVVVSVRRDAPASTVQLFLSNTDESFDSVALRILPASSVAAPLGVTSLVVSYPRAGSHIRTGQSIKPQGLLVVTGSGTVTGRWLIDGVVFDRFRVTARAGRSIPVTSRVPIPRLSLGSHRLQLTVDRPQRISSPAVRIFQTTAQTGGMRLITPFEGYVLGAEPLSFRWTPAPGAGAYEVELERPPGSRPLRYRTTDSRWQPTPAQRSEIGAGTHRWRVWTIFPGEVRQQPTEWRRVVLLPDRVQLEVLPPLRDGVSGRLEVRWTGGSPGLLYSLQVHTEDGRESLYSALAGAERHLLPLAAVAPGRARILVTALGPDGKDLGSAQIYVVIDAPVEAAGDEQQSLRSTGAVQEEPPDDGASLIKIMSLQPTDKSRVESSQPVIQAGWSGALTREQISLQVDATDVTALSKLTANSVTYTPLLMLAPGEHTIELSLAGQITRWTFSIAPADDQVEARSPATTNARWDWSVDAEGGITAYDADTHIDPDNAPLTLGGRVDYESDRFSLQSTVEAGGIRELEQQRRTLQENESWVIDAGVQGERNSAGLKAGYGTPGFLDQVEFLSSGQTRGGVEASVSRSSALKASLFHSFDPEMGNITSGDLDTEQKFRGAALEIGGGVKRYMLRLVGIDVQEEGTEGGDGSSYGLIGSYGISPHKTLTFEGARGEFDPVSGSENKSKSGNAARLGLNSEGESFDYEISVHHRDAGFVNPADPEFTDGGGNDWDKLQAILTRRFAGGDLTANLSYEEGEEGGDSSGSKAHLRSAVLGYNGQAGDDFSYTVSGNLTTTQAGSETQEKDYGIVITAMEIGKRLEFNETLSVQWHRDEVSSANNITTIDGDISVGGPLSEVLELYASFNAIHTIEDSTIGNTDELTLVIEPILTIVDSSLSFRPVLSYTVTMNDNEDNVNDEHYGLVLDWTLPWLAKSLTLSLGADWNRIRDGQVDTDSDISKDYTANLTYSWGRKGTRERQGVEIFSDLPE